jgi:AraC family transcriptional regulator of adaptative response / DNA-3-methyladenine glycosylase II
MPPGLRRGRDATVARATDRASAIPAGVDHLANEPSFHLPFRAPFAADALLSFLGARAAPGIEEVRGGAYRRSVRQPSGASVVEMTPRRAHVDLRASDNESPDLDDLRARARRAFDLDADPARIDTELSRDPALAPLVARLPGIRVPGTFDGFELVVRAIFGQQVSVAGARTSLGRLVARAGIPLERPDGTITHLFPTPERIAELSPESFGMPRARAETIRRVAALVARGDLDLSGNAPADDTLGTLAEVPGIGPWTLSYVAMRALGDHDAFMVGDLGVRKGFEALGLPSTPNELIARAERWRPWRAYAVMHLWHAHP